MRSYGQYCALAKALDVVGDRWTLLIVRELAVQGPSRYTDLRHGLPGIATNMLVDRLREMEENGIVQREDAPPPVATALFSLTERGKELMPVLFALGRWGVPIMGERGDDEWRGYWLKYPLEELFADAEPDQPPVTLELHTGDGPVTVETGDGRIRVQPGAAADPDAVVSGQPEDVIELLRGATDVRAARRQGVRVEGDVKALARVKPRD
ncbi:MAG TPA: winged helix-turn-helix transcriptional regulator [Acidimicrobiales bacterium]|nr:winged helix-turn-helix transcriptional regulator [Acidimicrobiales bacterium]